MNEIDKWFVSIAIIVGFSLFFYVCYKIVKKSMSPVRRTWGRCGEV